MKTNTLFILTLVTLCLCPLIASPAEVTTEKQKFSYIVGRQIGQSLLRQGVDVDPQAFAQGIEDMLSGTPSDLSDEETEAVTKSYQAKQQEARNALAKKNGDAGRAFLEANKSKEGVVVLPSGLQYKVVQEGTGKHPSLNDTVVVNYRGTTINGNEFDSSYQRGEPVTLQLTNVIKGWQEALPLMSEGAKWQLYVPTELAYGERGAGGAIGPNETLIFDVELITVQ
ncbi:MAG: FKBP-type peptidyl-prolyl cis-trans isomerase [Gammaproteobacteria bacterium]|nr:FKBP-type peptidyl-prolyl cis-trans isomerase [Gammaproteobacteria bacterium]MCI0590254.1 FKBP-type peptidyl-prolyl cis-trans isomerase [Gammaproteobacteria bacterium]